MDQRVKSRLHIVGLVTLTVLTRVGIYLALRPRWTFDGELPWDGWGRISLYMSRGWGLADTSRLTYFPLGDVPLPTAARPPLPIFVFAATLRAFGEHLLPIVLVQSAIDAATAVLIYLTVCRLCRTRVFDGPSLSERHCRTTALLAASTFACFVPEWRYVVGFQSEPLFTLLLSGALAATILGNRRHHLAFAGLLFGLAALARPAVLIVPIALAAWLRWGEGVGFRHAALAPALMALVLVPWAYRNYLVFREPIVTQTLLGYDLYRHSGAIAEEDYLRWVPVEEGNAKIEELLGAQGLSPAAVSEPDLDRLLRHEALKIIQAHPWRYLNLSLHRATWLFYDPNNVGGRTGPVVRVIYLVFLLALFSLIGMALWRYGGSEVHQLTPVWLMLGHTIGIHALLVSQFRYLLPMVPWLLCVAAYAAMRGYVELRSGVRYLEAA